MNAAGLLVSAVGLLSILIGGWMALSVRHEPRVSWPVQFAVIVLLLLAGGGVLVWWGYHPDADWAAIWGAMKGT